MSARTGPPLVRILGNMSAKKAEAGRSEHTFRMLVAQGTLAHVCEFYCAFRARVHEPITALWVKLCSSDDLRQLLHICRLDINDIEALVLDVEVPKVDPQVIATDESFPIAVDRYTVNMVGVCVRIRSARYSCDNSIMVCHARKLERRSIAERDMVCPWRTASSCTCWCKILRQIVLCDYFQGLFEDLP